MRAPAIGDTLLFVLQETPRIERPLLVTHVTIAPTSGVGPALVTGEVFLRSETDGNSEWARKHMFWKLTPGDKNRSIEVKGIAEGTGVGMWRWRTQPVEEKKGMVQQMREALR